MNRWSTLTFFFLDQNCGIGQAYDQVYSSRRRKVKLTLVAGSIQSWAICWHDCGAGTSSQETHGGLQAQPIITGAKQARRVSLETGSWALCYGSGAWMGRASGDLLDKTKPVLL